MPMRHRVDKTINFRHASKIVKATQSIQNGIGKGNLDSNIDNKLIESSIRDQNLNQLVMTDQKHLPAQINSSDDYLLLLKKKSLDNMQERSLKNPRRSTLKAMQNIYNTAEDRFKPTTKKAQPASLDKPKNGNKHKHCLKPTKYDSKKNENKKKSKKELNNKVKTAIVRNERELSQYSNNNEENDKIDPESNLIKCPVIYHQKYDFSTDDLKGLVNQVKVQLNDEKTHADIKKKEAQRELAAIAIQQAVQSVGRKTLFKKIIKFAREEYGDLMATQIESVFGLRKKKTEKRGEIVRDEYMLKMQEGEYLHPVLEGRICGYGSEGESRSSDSDDDESEEENESESEDEQINQSEEDAFDRQRRILESCGGQLVEREHKPVPYQMKSIRHKPEISITPSRADNRPISRPPAVDVNISLNEMMDQKSGSAMKMIDFPSKFDKKSPMFETLDLMEIQHVTCSETKEIIDSAKQSKSKVNYIASRENSAMKRVMSLNKEECRLKELVINNQKSQDNGAISLDDIMEQHTGMNNGNLHMQNSMDFGMNEE